jgi:phytoene dehydrogenase-like protein
VQPKVVVVGAGISGLTAAWFLDKAGYDVVVLEQHDAPGGRMRQVEREGVQINTGARLLYTFYTVVMELIKELNLESEMEYLSMSELLCDDGHQRYPVSFSPNPSLLMIPVLTRST